MEFFSGCSFVSSYELRDDNEIMNLCLNFEALNEVSLKIKFLMDEWISNSILMVVS